MGGGTTIVEAVARGRWAIGSDINSLATFISQVKTTPLTSSQWGQVQKWLDHSPLHGVNRLAIKGEQRHSPGDLPIEIERPLSKALRSLPLISETIPQAVARCALLRLGQWALESAFLYPRDVNKRNRLPTIRDLERKLNRTVACMRSGMEALVDSAHEYDVSKSDLSSRRLIILSHASELSSCHRVRKTGKKAKLILTSPPYPGVHVLYHRWQVGGRKETAAPYWITGSEDGQYGSFYTMGSRTPTGLDHYFRELTNSYRALRPLLSNDCVLAQLVAFSNARQQLPVFLDAVEKAGFREVSEAVSSRTTRDVVNRRWYARRDGYDAGREYLLVHRVAKETRVARRGSACESPG